MAASTGNSAFDQVVTASESQLQSDMATLERKAREYALGGADPSGKQCAIAHWQRVYRAAQQYGAPTDTASAQLFALGADRWGN